MKNGDRLSGEMITQSGDTIKFKTPYADPFVIRWSEVKELKTEKPVTTLMKNGGVAEIEIFSEEFIAKNEIDSIKPEPYRLGETWKFRGIANLALKLERGNIDSDEYDVDSNITLRDLKNRFTFHGNLENDERNGDNTADNWEARPEYNRFLNKRLYTGALFSTESNKFADLNRRLGYGPLVGYQFYEEERTNLKGRLATLFIDEEFNNSPDQDFWAGGWEIDFDYYIIMDVLQFYHRNGGFVNVEDSDKVYLHAWTGFRWPIYLRLVGSLEYEVEYDSEPSDDAKEHDTAVSMKLGYQW
ncbi:DUF481 domain-containing protein [Oligoflexia bacterium]|nr:DUF481 domain-containing protein [Oligoflexia bacterium]